MTYFRFIFLLLLLPAIARGKDPLMGPEIEFRGKRQLPSMICKGMDYPVTISFGGGVLGTAGMLVKARLEKEKDSGGVTAFVPMMVGTGATAVVVAACLKAFASDKAVSLIYLRRIHDELEPRQKAGELTLRWMSDTAPGREALIVEHKNGRKIIFGTDLNVVEVKLPPITPQDLNDNLEFYEKELYEPAQRAGLKIPRLDGPWNGGHVHVDIARAFDSDPRKLKNFILDFIEHRELADGVLVKDSYNALPIDAAAKAPDIEALVHHLDLWAEEGKKLTAFELTELSTFAHQLFNKGSALNINTVYGTLEVRSLRSQKNARELAKVMRLLEARIKYTNNLPEKSVPLTPKLSTEEKAAAFRSYVEESGLDYAEFRELAPKRFHLDCAGQFSRIAP